MKKSIAVLMALIMLFAFRLRQRCRRDDVKGEGVMTYAEYIAALDSEVVVETYVQAKQSGGRQSHRLFTG